jgi:hypothetical protein
MTQAPQMLLVLLIALGGLVPAYAQTLGSITGPVADQSEAVIPNATVLIKNTGTGVSRSTTTSSDGRYHFVNVPAGTYELTVEAASFSKYVRQGIILDVSQNAVLDLIKLKAGTAQEVVTVTENASFLNTTTAEVSTSFDRQRVAELPIAPDGNVYNILLSSPGVSRASPSQAVFPGGINLSSNGGRLRSNNFMIDGQDINDPNISGPQIPLNNPDAIGQVRIVTNQFLAEYGRNSGSIVSITGKSGTNQYHGSGFIFYNGNRLNSCSNLDKAAGFCNPAAADDIQRRAPSRKEFRYGFTLGGPLTLPWFGDGKRHIWKGTDKTFFFGDYLKWSDRQLGSGATINGAPTAAGRAALQQYFGQLPQVKALLAFVPPGITNFTNITAAGQVIQVGDLTASSPVTSDNTQGSLRIDHVFNGRNVIYSRYRGSTAFGDGEQVTPPGLSTQSATTTHALTLAWNLILSNQLSNEARVAWTRLDARFYARDPSSNTIPSIEIAELGMNGTSHVPSRTAFGSATNLPQTRKTDVYQVTDNLSYLRGHHTFKFGVDFHRRNVESFFIANTRGRLQYTTLDNFLLDRAQVAIITQPLRGGDILAHYGWNEVYAYAQDEWKLRPTLTMTLGLRYEYPGDSFGSLVALNQRILAANGNSPAFAFSPLPQVDTNNLMPRIGFNWNPNTRKPGVIGFLTGGNKSVIRGGYSRTYDPSLIVINATTFNSFPFVASQNVSPTQPSFATIQSLRGGSPTIPSDAAAMLLTRTAVAPDFRLPYTDQFSLDYQRELTSNAVMRIGYIRTQGNDLIQTVDGNPRLPCPFGSGLPGTITCNSTGIDPLTGTAVPIVLAPRVDPARGTIQLRANSGSSTYDALQVSFEKRPSRGFSGGLHYTWSRFIDTASDIFNPLMDPFNLSADRGRSSYDRSHHLVGNFVYELPFKPARNGWIGRLLGGWQVNTSFTFQSGAPFSVLNGSDPAGALAGIDAFAGNGIRPNVYTKVDVSRMSVAELYTINQQLLHQALATAQANFNALPTGPCIPGLLPGTPLNDLLFARPTGRITCSGTGVRGVTVDLNGVEPRQRFGNAGRNILRSDGYRDIDFGVVKNTQFTESVRIQFRADIFNLFNQRNFGIPEGGINSASFLNQWATDGGNRRIVLGARLVF